MDEEQAIQRLKRGDVGGLEILVHHYQVKAVRTAYLITGDVELAEDVVQEAFLKVCSAIRTFACFLSAASCHNTPFLEL